MEFLEIGTEGNPIQELTHGVTVTNDWMQEMIDGDVEKRTIWAKVLQSRGEMGYPYIFFTDNANNGTPDVYKDKSYLSTQVIYVQKLCCLQTMIGLLFAYCQALIYCIMINGKILMLLKQ